MCSTAAAADAITINSFLNWHLFLEIIPR